MLHKMLCDLLADEGQHATEGHLLADEGQHGALLPLLLVLDLQQGRRCVPEHGNIILLPFLAANILLLLDLQEPST
jgi:hypothetical protein